MKNVRLFLPILCLLILSGCGTTTIVKPKESYSGFDQSRNVHIRPHGNIPNSLTDMWLTGVGAFWSDSSPDRTVLIIALFNKWSGITGAQLNIDGKIITLKETASLTDLEGGYDNGVDMMKISTQGFMTDLDVVVSILHSDRTWLRVYTTDGVFEHGIIDGEKDSKAYNALKEFVSLVKKK